MKFFEDLVAGGLVLPFREIRGAHPGPRILVTAGIHGAEYVGIEAARRLVLWLAALDPGSITGSVAVAPCCNPAAFAARVPAVNPVDGKNINRCFPPVEDDGATSSDRIAACIAKLAEESAFHIDLHGGDLHERLRPYVYFQGACAEAAREAGREACRFVDVDVRVRSSATSGAYNASAIRGTPSILIERGQGGRWSEAEVEAYLRDLRSLLVHLGTLDAAIAGELNARRSDDGQLEMEALYEGASVDGLWHPLVDLGDCVRPGELMGELRDFDGNILHRAVAKKAGVVLYMAGTLFVPAGRDLVAY